MVKATKALSVKLHSPAGLFWAFAVFMICVFLMGGGSRDDIRSLVILRPLAIMFAAYAIVTRPEGMWRGRLFPAWTVVALAILMLAQLVAMPPQMWGSLPGREIYSDIAAIAGLEAVWRPLTLSPSRTLNSIMSLSVPIAAILLFLNLDPRYHRHSILLILGLIVTSSFLSIVQLLGQSNSAFYLYEVTNNGLPVGLFANRNHHALMLCIGIVVAGWCAAGFGKNPKYRNQAKIGAGLLIFVLVPVIFLAGSRLGLLLLLPAIVTSVGLLSTIDRSMDGANKRSSRRDGSEGRIPGIVDFLRKNMIYLIGAAAILIGLLFVLFSRSLAFDRLLGKDPVTDLRTQLFPTFGEMTWDFLPWGSGFGTFEFAFRRYETGDLLRPSYLNQAHNDWAQLAIEGGLPAIILLLVAIMWIVVRAGKILFDRLARSRDRQTAILCAIVFLFMAASSLVDYPLRVPSHMAVASVFACLLAGLGRNKKKSQSR